MGQPLYIFMRNRFKDILKKQSFALGKGVTLIRRVYTRTKDEAGRLTDITETDTNIKGYISFVSEKDKQLLEQGWVQVGDAILFVEHDTTINVEDGIIDTDSVEWEVTKLINAPKVHGKVIRQKFTLKRR